MRTNVKARPAAMAGALALAIGIPAIALGAGTSQAQSATVIKVSHTHVRYGDRVTVTGTTSTGAAGQRLELEFAQNGSTWRQVATTTAGSNGSYRLRAKLYRSGFLRVSTPAIATTAAGPLTSASTAGAQPSVSQRVTVRGKLVVGSAPRSVLGSRPVTVGGRLLPALVGRRVVLETRVGRGWNTVAHARTRAGGRFTLRFVPGGLGSEQLRVRFAGDGASARTAAPSGLLTVYQQTVASWYNDGGGTACGFHAGLGVANKTLPCGTKVTLMYGGRRVTATVDDRGPFVAGRTWDLNQTTAAALGFAGVATVWSSR
jgi:peptidoglycan lytic transglycosylase